MRTQCSHCRQVWSIIASPNGTEGHWLSDVMIEALDDYVSTQHGEDVLHWIYAHTPVVHRCPACGKLTVIGEAREPWPPESGKEDRTND